MQQWQETGPPLHIAAISGGSECVKLLINANLNAKTIHGKTPLDLAKEKNHTECIRLLKEAGAK